MKYRKKPVVIEAVQYFDRPERMYEMSEFIQNQEISFTKEGKMIICTLEGNMTADEGDFIIKGVSGEYYPCKPDIFEKTYEKVE